MSEGVLLSEKAVVNVDNEFTFKGMNFKIDELNIDYHVSHRYDEVEEYENFSLMELITVELNENMQLRFYNEDGIEIYGVHYQKRN